MKQPPPTTTQPMKSTRFRNLALAVASTLIFGGLVEGEGETGTSSQAVVKLKAIP